MQAEHTLQLSTEDATSIEATIRMLEDEAAGLGADSKVADIWRDWAHLLRPTLEEQELAV